MGNTERGEADHVERGIVKLILAAIALAAIFGVAYLIYRGSGVAELERAQERAEQLNRERGF